MTASRLEGDQYINGNLNSKTLTIPAGTILNAAIGAGAAIATAKMLHRHAINYKQQDGANVTDTTGEGCPVFICRTAGALVAIEASCPDAPTGTGTVTIDLKKAEDGGGLGATFLTAVITIDSGNADYSIEAGTLANSTLAAGDVLMIIVDETDGDTDPPQGLIVTITVDMDPA